MTVHRFADSLEASQRHADAPWWEDVYREAFPTFQGMVNVRDDGAGQRNGIDRHVILSNGRTVTVDEKVRERDYPDFFLEYYSNVNARTRGWVAKDLACDFIAYAFARSGRCYLLPFPMLRRAWRQHHKAWCRTHPSQNALNEGYITRGCCVPIAVVLTALGESTLVTFTPEPEKAAA